MNDLQSPEVEKILVEMVIQRVRGKDFDQLFALVSKGFEREIAITGFDARRLLRVARLYRLFGALLPLLEAFRVDLPIILVAVSQNILIGEIHLTPHGKDVWSIDSVTVDAEFRGHGVYRRLMEEALKYVSGRRGKRIVQSVRTDNVAPVKIAEELNFQIMGENLLLLLEFSGISLTKTETDVIVREFMPADRKQVYEICRSMKSTGTGVYDNLLEDFEDSLSRHLMNRLSGSYSRRWVVDLGGKIAGYAKVMYTSSGEAGVIEYFFVLASQDSSRLESVLMNTIVVYLAMNNINKVVVSLNKERKHTMEIFEQIGFKRVASSYEMMKAID